MSEIKYYGKRRSIIRRIGSFLPLKPPPKIYVSVTPLHSMTSSMVNEEASSNYTDTNGYGQGRHSTIQTNLIKPISFGSEVRLLALEQELQELREQISTIMKNNKMSKHASVVSLPNGAGNGESQPSSSEPAPSPPIPPPLPPPPTTPHIARRASLQDHKVEDHKKIALSAQKSLGNILKDVDSIKLGPNARSRGHSTRVKRENSPCNELQKALRERYMEMNKSTNKYASLFSLNKDNSL